MTYQFLSGFHIVSSVSALIFGLCVLLTHKGTRLHKQFGYAYFFNMLGLNISALFIYRLTGHFGPFHGADGLIEIAWQRRDSKCLPLPLSAWPHIVLGTLGQLVLALDPGQARRKNQCEGQVGIGGRVDRTQLHPG